MLCLFLLTCVACCCFFLVLAFYFLTVAAPAWSCNGFQQPHPVFKTLLVLYSFLLLFSVSALLLSNVAAIVACVVITLQLYLGKTQAGPTTPAS